MRRRRRQSGNVFVELAAGVAVLGWAFTGTFQFGYSFYRYNQLAAAINNGAHYAAMRCWDSTDGTVTSTYSTAVKNVVIYNDPTGTNMTTPIAPGFGTSNVTVTANGQTGSSGPQPPASVTVAVSGYTLNTIFGSFTMNGKPSVTYPFQGLVTDGYSNTACQ